MTALRFLLAAWLFAAAAALTNEDIVRMVASGASEREVLEAIASHAEAFDLTDDMIEELSVAGVSAPIRAAMRRKHAESAAATPPPERSPRGQAPLTVTLNAGGSGGSGPRTLRGPAWADEDLKARFHLPKENDQREVKDLAVFLACVRSDHVPDLWRSKTPLGRDMVEAPRHEMLAFTAGDTPAGEKPRLTLPDRIEADVDASDAHDILLGVAARIGDRWVYVAGAKLSKVEVGGQAAKARPLAGRITRGGGDLSFKVALTAPK